MPDIHYVPSIDGGLMVLAGADRVLSLYAPVDSALQAELWAALTAAADNAGVLDVLVRGGLSAIPPFALVGADENGDRLALVRGAIEVAIEGAETVSGEGVSSWREVKVPAGAAVSIWPATVPADSVTLPLRLGTVIAAAFRFGELGVASAVSEAKEALSGPFQAASAAPIAGASADSLTPKNILPAPRVTPVTAPIADPGVTLASHTITSMPPAGDSAVISAPPPTPSAPDAGGYDHLFGQTVMRSVEDAAVREATDENAPRDSAEVADKTEFVDRGALRERRRAARESKGITESPRLYLELSTGGTEYIDQPLVIGRAPAVERVSGANIPRPVVMTTPNQDISRTHAQIAAEGGTVVVTDLHSSNGTLVTMPGKPAQKLRPGEPTAVIVGTVIDLGDGATLTVRQS